MHGASAGRNTSAGAVIPYYVAASLAFFLASAITLLSYQSFFGHYFQPRLLAVTHLMALGWGTMMIFGALFQFLPVLLETPLFSERLCKLSFWLMLTGISGLVYSFWNFNVGWPMQVSSLIVLAGAVLFSYNVLKTCRMAKAWNVSADFIATSSGWLLLTILAGIILVLNFRYLFLPQDHLHYLKVHAHLGIVGWFLLLIIGVSSRLMPMFLVSANPPKKWLSPTFYLVNAGLLGFIADALIFNIRAITILAFISVVAGLVLYGIYLRSCYRNRVRKNPDTGLKVSLLAFLVIGLPVVLMSVILFFHAGERFLLPFYITYGCSIFFGFISTLICGQVYKTLPFIVWLRLREAGSAEKKLPADLFSESMAKYQMIFHLVGFCMMLPALLYSLKFLLLAAAGCMVVSALLFNLNVFKILNHLLK